jgi:sigma-B regulation protein RsbU (phosphoserine phosphatase)
MKILIADDNLSIRTLLQKLLKKIGFQILVAEDGQKAWELLEKEENVPLVILDWMMPNMNGIEFCNKIRNDKSKKSIYIIMLTAQEGKDNAVAALKAGADDFITKPFNNSELNARINAGKRIIELQENLFNRITELEDALSQVKQLQGLLPICSYCKNIRDDKNYWHKVESYISKNTDANFTHSICPKCYENVVKPQIKKLKNEKK